MAEAKKEKYNMTEGPILGKLIKYSIPIVGAGILQLLYNAADTVVAGRFAEDGETALAAVGSCGALINLIVGLFMGLSTGAGVCVSHDYGAGRFEEVRKTVHTAIPTSAILGLLVGLFGYLFARPLLALTGVEEPVLSEATPYLQAYMTGIPASMIYNYCATMLRSTGDTVRPLIFLSISGLINVALNLITVIVFNLGALGVGIATSISTWLSLVFIIVFMLKSDNCMNFTPKDMKLYWDKLKKIIIIGIPSGLQGCLFSLSNVIIQSSVNSFGKTVMAGNAASSNIQGFTYTAMNAVYHAALTFVGQNVGAKKYKRIKKILFLSILTVVAIGVSVTALTFIFIKPLLNLYIPDNQPAFDAAMVRMWYVGLPYFLCGIMEVCSGTMRGMGYSTKSMLVSLIGSCVTRIAWIYTIFAAYHTLESLYVSYPITWFLTSGVALIFIYFDYKKLIRTQGKRSLASQLE